MDPCEVEPRQAAQVEDIIAWIVGFKVEVLSLLCERARLRFERLGGLEAPATEAHRVISSERGPLRMHEVVLDDAGALIADALPELGDVVGGVGQRPEAGGEDGASLRARDGPQRAERDTRGDLKVGLLDAGVVEEVGAAGPARLIDDVHGRLSE